MFKVSSDRPLRVLQIIGAVPLSNGVAGVPRRRGTFGHGGMSPEAQDEMRRKRIVQKETAEALEAQIDERCAQLLVLGIPFGHSLTVLNDAFQTTDAAAAKVRGAAAPAARGGRL